MATPKEGTVSWTIFTTLPTERADSVRQAYKDALDDYWSKYDVDQEDENDPSSDHVRSWSMMYQAPEAAEILNELTDEGFTIDAVAADRLRTCKDEFRLNSTGDTSALEKHPILVACMSFLVARLSPGVVLWDDQLELTETVAKRLAGHATVNDFGRGR
jgi:hypothetical protein